MNENEFKFLVINTQSLWQEGTIEPDATGADSMEITKDGISLRKFYTHTLTERSSFGTILPVDFALDSSGLLYVLDSKEKKVAVIDRNLSPGSGGVLAQEVRACLYSKDDCPAIFGFGAGLGGQDVTPEIIGEVVERALQKDEPWEDYIWMGLLQ